MKTMTVSEAEAGFARLLRWVANGEEVEILDHQQAVAKVVPLRKRAEVSLAAAAEALRADYQDDPDLTAFTTLDGEDFHAAR